MFGYRCLGTSMFTVGTRAMPPPVIHVFFLNVVWVLIIHLAKSFRKFLG